MASCQRCNTENIYDLPRYRSKPSTQHVTRCSNTLGVFNIITNIGILCFMVRYNYALWFGIMAKFLSIAWRYITNNYYSIMHQRDCKKFTVIYSIIFFTLVFYSLLWNTTLAHKTTHTTYEYKKLGCRRVNMRCSVALFGWHAPLGELIICRI